MPRKINIATKNINLKLYEHDYALIQLVYPHVPTTVVLRKIINDHCNAVRSAAKQRNPKAFNEEPV